MQERPQKLFKAHISALFLFLCFILSSKPQKKIFIKFPTIAVYICNIAATYGRIKKILDSARFWTEVEWVLTEKRTWYRYD